MKRKIIAAVMSALMMLNIIPAFAATPNGAPDVTPAAGQLYATLSGTIDIGTLYAGREYMIKDRYPYNPLQLAITITDTTPDPDVVLYKNQLSLTETAPDSNVYDYSTNFILSVDNGEYNIKLSTPYRTIYNGPFTYTDGTVAKLNDITTATDMETFLNANARYLDNLNLTVFNDPGFTNTDRENMCNSLITGKPAGGYTTKASVAEAMEKAIFDASLASSTVSDEAKVTLLNDRLIDPQYDEINGFISEYDVAVDIINDYAQGKIAGTYTDEIQDIIEPLALKAYAATSVENTYDLEVLFESDMFLTNAAVMAQYTACQNKTAFFDALNSRMSGVDTLADFETAVTESIAAASISPTPTPAPVLPPNTTTYSGPSGSSGSRPITPVIPQVTPAPTAPPAQSTGFGDMAGYEWASEAVDALSAAGIIDGDGEGNYNPQDNVTREQCAKMLAGAFKLVISADNAQSFTDVGENDWFYEAVMACLTNGVTDGVTDTSFGVGTPITRQDAAVMLGRVMKLTDELAGGAFADDSEIADYAKASVYAMKNLAIINGYDDNTFAPRAYITRAEAAKMIYSAMQYDGSEN